METWTLSVKEWQDIISKLEKLQTPKGTSFNKLKGFNKTRVYNNAILLGRNKISPQHRNIVPSTIRRISIQCKGRSKKYVLAIKLPRNLCNLIRSQSPTPLN